MPRCTASSAVAPRARHARHPPPRQRVRRLPHRCCPRRACARGSAPCRRVGRPHACRLPHCRPAGVGASLSVVASPDLPACPPSRSSPAPPRNIAALRPACHVAAALVSTAHQRCTPECARARGASSTRPSTSAQCSPCAALLHGQTRRRALSAHAATPSLCTCTSEFAVVRAQDPAALRNAAARPLACRPRARLRNRSHIRPPVPALVAAAAAPALAPLVHEPVERPAPRQAPILRPSCHATRAHLDPAAALPVTQDQHEVRASESTSPRSARPPLSRVPQQAGRCIAYRRRMLACARARAASRAPPHAVAAATRSFARARGRAAARLPPQPPQPLRARLHARGLLCASRYGQFGRLAREASTRTL
jgi:hypothetical protein